MSESVSRWIARSQKPAAEPLRLFCFPYAGGGASTYRTWEERLNRVVGIYPVQLPGRENRLADPPFTEFAPLQMSLVQALCPFFDRPFAFFGHSMGALIAFELARTLRRLQLREPVALLVSGAAAPQRRRASRAIHRLGDADFIVELRRLNGTPEAVLNNPDLMDLLLPILRADFAVDETYAYRHEAPLSYPIYAFGGDRDEDVSEEALSAWGAQTTNAFRAHVTAGDHFFINASEIFFARLRDEVNELLRRVRTTNIKSEAAR